MADGMFDDLVPEQKPAAGAGMFDDLVPRAAVPNAPVAALGEPAPTAGRVDVGPIEVLGDDYAVPTVAGVPDYSGVFVDPEAQNDGLARIGLRALVGRAPELVASAIEAPATANEALSRAIGLEDSGLGLGLFDSMRGLLRRGASAVRELGYEGDMAQAGYGEPSVSGGDLVEALNPYANENRAAAAAEFGDGAGYDPLTLGERAARVATFVPETLLASAPDMAATLNPLSLGAYMASRGNEIAHARAAADNRSDVTLSDVAAGGVAAPIEATLERFTTGRLLPGGTGDVLGDGIAAALGRVGRETALQGGIGGVEEVVPYLAETLGTQTGSTPQGALESFVGGLVAEGGLGGTVQTVKEALGARRPSAQDAPPTDEPLVDIEPEAEGDAELDALIEQAIPAETLAAARAELGLEDDATPAEVARAAVSAIDLSGADVAPVLDRLQLDRALGDEAPVLDASRLPPLGETDSPAPAQSAQGAAPIQGSPNPTEQPAGALPTPSSPPAQAEPPTARPQVPGGEEATIGKLYRRGSGKSRSSAEAFRAPSGKWYTRHRSSGQWSDWQERDSFDPARIHGYRETTGRGGSVRIPGVGSFPVERGEAAAPAEPNPLLDLIVGAGGISREDARRMGVDPAEMNARVGVRPIFGRNGIALDSLRERLIEDGYLPPEPEDAPPSTDVNDVWELASRAIAGEPVYPMNDPRQIEAQMRAFEEQQGPEQSPEDARDEALALWYDEVGNETGEDIQPGDEAEVASIVDLVDRFGDDDMGFSAAPARDPFESEAEYAARLWEALEEQRGAYQEATQGGVRESLGGQEGRQAEPVQGAGDGFTFGQEPAAPAPEAREVAPTQGAGLFGAPSARDFVDAARRDRDARRDGLTGTGRTDMAAGDGELFAGPRPEQADIEPPPARPSRSTDGLESVEAPFYSAALRAIEQGKGAPKRGDAAAWRGWLDGAVRRGDMKQSERDWLGIDDWLAQQDGPVTREALADFVRANEVQVQDVVLGEQSADDRNARQREVIGRLEREFGISAMDDGDGGFDWFTLEDDFPVEEWPGESASLRDEFLSLAADEVASGGPAKFASYQLPGGESYRELLLTLPESVRDIPAGWRVEDQGESKTGPTRFVVLDANGASKAYAPDRETAVQRAVAFAKRNTGAAPTSYISSHFDQPNILAHVRFNERTDADGKRVLFLEEIQSDWHQEGRKRGYAGNPVAARFDSREKAEKANGRADGEGVVQVGDQWSFIPRQSYRVPDAPLKGTDEWSMLAFKRMVRHAAENGFDRIAWTTGDQQNARYDLSKQVDSIEYAPVRDGTYNLAVYKDGRNVLNRNGITIDEVESLVGKDVATKIQSGEASGYNPGTGYAQLSGLDLQVGGDGMRGFYDRILPKAVNKWAKRFGGRVGRAQVGIGETDPKPWKAVDVTDEGGGGIEAAFATEEEANRFGNEEGGVRIEYQPGGFAPAHAIDITPAMREAALAGQPLFREEPGRQPESGQRTPEQSAALGEEDAERLGLRGAVDDALAGAAVRVEFLRGLEGLPDRLRRGVERRLAERDGKGRTAALYDPVEKRVFIFTDVVTTADRAIWNAAHEIAGHHGLRELLGERLDRALEIALQNPTVQSVADAIAAERKIDTRSQSGRMLAAEEALAELAAAARTDNWAEIEGRYSTPVSETMRERVTRAIDNFIKRLKALMEDIFGRPNFSDADVRELLEAAWQAARQPVTEGRPSAALESSAQDQTQTPAFRAWFGDSKVVDENGEPLVVYHGTVSSFDEFSDDHRGKVTRATSSKAGFFFASSPRTAQSYADHGAIVTPVQELVSQAETAGNRGNWDEHDRLMSEAETLEAGLVGEGRARGQSLMPVYLSLQNPLEINAAGENPEGIGGINSLIAQAKRRGHDGVIIRNFDDAAGLYDDNADHFVAFYPEQIKSATGNRGTFDPERASILEAVEASDHRLPDRRGLSPAQSAGLRLAEDDVRRADRNPLEERGVIANARQDIADQIEEARQFAKGRPKNPQSLVRRANGARAYWTDAIVSRARSLTRRNPQSKALRELFNRVMNLEPGTDKVTGEILLEATARRYAAFTNRARNIIADTFGSDRLNERQNARLRKAMLTDGASGDAEADRAAKRLRKLMDTAKEDMIAAGIEVGEVEDIGYLTRLYDDAKILDDEAGFTAAATKLYRDHEFDKEIGRNGRAILYGDGTLPLFVNWAKRAGMGGDPIIKAGLSQLKTALRGYRSQSNVGGQNAEIIKIIDTLLPRVRQFYGETNADSWLHKIATPTAGQVFNGIGPSGAPVTKGRTLSGAADTVMADYLKTDMFDILDTYARVTSKKIAMAERFGPKGEKVDELIGAARREGVKKPDLDEAQELAESAMGNFSAVSERAKGTIDALQAWGTLTLLGRVAFASVAEPITFAMRTGQARHVIAPLTQVWRAVGDRKRGKELRDFAVMLGVNGNKAMEVVMQNQLGGDYGMTPRWAGLVGKFMEANLLSPLTRAQRAYGVGAANGFLRHVAQNVADGKRLGEMGVYLNELGIADHAAFSTWMLAQGGLPNPSELYDSDGRPTPRGQDYIVAVRRLIDQTIQNPNASHRPQWQNSPAGRVFGGIMGFSYAAYENVIKAELRRIKTIAKVEGVDAAAVRASKTATGALALIFGQTIVGTIREALFNPDRFEDKDDEELYPELMLLGLQRSFGLGSLDPVVQLYTGLKYQRSSAETILGAYIGTAAKTADRFLGVAGGQNSPNTDTAEYRAAESVYSSLITPVANALLSRVPLAGGPLIMASSSGQARRKFAGLFFDQPEPRTKLDDDYQAMQAEMTDLTQQVSEQLRLKPVDQWAEEFERLREEYPDLLAGASLEFYKRDGKYGRKGEPKRNAQGEPVIDLTGGDEAGGSVMGELQGYTGWRTRDGKREQYETEGIEDRITALNKAIRQVRGSDDLTYAGVFKVIRDVPSELPQTLELAREFDAGRPGALDTPEAQKVAPQSVRRTLLRELQEARQAEKRRALEVVERGRRGEAPSGDVDGRAPPRGIGRSSMPESRRAEYLGIGEGGRATPAPDVLAGAKNAPDLVMVGDWSGIESEAVRNALDSGAEGVYDPETRKAYVVNGLPEAHARFVAYHEIAGHHGLRGALGDEYESVLNRAMQNPTVSKIADEMGVDAYRGTYRLDRVEEALSELAAAARTGDYDRLEQTWGVEIPPSARRGVSGALRRMVQATKRTIGNLTGDEPDAFDDAQVYSLIEDAWQYVKDDPRDR